MYGPSGPLTIARLTSAPRVTPGSQRKIYLLPVPLFIKYAQTISSVFSIPVSNKKIALRFLNIYQLTCNSQSSELYSYLCRPHYIVHLFKVGSLAVLSETTNRFNSTLCSLQSTTNNFKLLNIEILTKLYLHTKFSILNVIKYLQ